MIRTATMALAALVVSAGFALADPIEGNWRTASGETAAISGGGTFSIVLRTGKYAGRKIGSMSADGGNSYSGTITDPQNDKTYSGTATLSGSSLRMTGCALKIFCRSQTWRKQ